ncbi:single-stranded DNA-binding protein [Streptomyces sp. NPDC048696]|uniref:single-stranded DNA-binding protein n=1 Tax=Streptomyces sp. NPDC048696 TaxID=3365585 RepID=UPI00371C4413
MSLPTLTGVGRIVADPELSFTQSGKAVARIRLAFNSRRKNDRGEWVDGDTFWVRGTAWERLAEHVAETLAKGMEVLVSGEVRTESWEKDGQKHQATTLLIRSIGPSLAYATATVTRSTGTTTNAGHPAPTRPATPADDPWATEPAPAEPPF